MVPTRPTELHQRRLRLAREPIAAAQARTQVRAAIHAWQVPVDPDIAVLLTSDLVTSAVTHGNGENVTLAITCSSRGHLRVEVYDTSRFLPGAVDGPVGTHAGRGLVLVAALSTEWGAFRTPAGEAVYFTLAFDPDLLKIGDGAAAGDTWRLWAVNPPGSLSPPVAHLEKTPSSEGVT